MLPKETASSASQQLSRTHRPSPTKAPAASRVAPDGQAVVGLDPQEGGQDETPDIARHDDSSGQDRDMAVEPTRPHVGVTVE
jgi:hypothetical protein